MNQEVKTKWINALRSGKYKQTKKKLRDHQGFCCLGVLCDVYLKETGKGEWVNFLFKIEDQVMGGVPPPLVVKWAELEDENPIPVKDDRSCSLAEYNDYENYDFNQIADLIEKHL